MVRPSFVDVVVDRSQHQQVHRIHRSSFYVGLGLEWDSDMATTDSMLATIETLLGC